MVVIVVSVVVVMIVLYNLSLLCSLTTSLLVAKQAD